MNNAWILLIVVIAVAVMVAVAMRDKSVSAAIVAPPCPTCNVEVLPTLALAAGATGTKRALLIGCNYKFPGSACVNYGCTLSGCIDDVKNMRTMLLANGYERANITFLVDDGSTLMPTKAKITESLQSIVSSMQAGDKTIVWYSGHGSHIENPSADGGYDECWCPPDTIQSGSYLSDNVLSSIVRQAPPDSSIFVGSDSCHSATILDLKYILADNASMPNRGPKSIERVRGRLPISIQSLKSLKPFVKRARATAIPKVSKGPMTVLGDSLFEVSQATIACLSGCQDFDTSADAFEDGQPQGAMTWAFLASFHVGLTFTDLLHTMRANLVQSGYSQVPQLTLGKLFNPNLTTLGSMF